MYCIETPSITHLAPALSSRAMAVLAFARRLAVGSTNCRRKPRPPGLPHNDMVDFYRDFMWKYDEIWVYGIVWGSNHEGFDGTYIIYEASPRKNGLKMS